MKNSSISLSYSFLFVSSLIVLILHGSSVNGVDIVNETCKKAVANDPQLKYDVCVASLEANPKSKTADLLGLGIISLENVLSKATSIISDIKKLTQGGGDPRLQKHLDVCSEVYDDAVDSVKEAIDYFNKKDFGTANIQISAAMDASSDCEDGFKEDQGLASPLTKQDGDFFQLTAISLSIANQLNK